MSGPSGRRRTGHRGADRGLGLDRRPRASSWTTSSGTCATDCPGWTVKDQLSHLIGIERMLLGDPSPPPLDRGASPRAQPVRGDERGVGGGPPWRARARGPGRVRRGHQPADRRPAAMDGADSSTRWGGARLATFPTASSWTPGSSTPGPTSRTSGGRWTGPAVATAPASAVVLDRCERTMPFVVGKRVAPPDGTVGAVRGDRGAWAATSGVTVDDGRAVAEAAPPAGQPSVTLTMDQEAFWRLGASGG